MMYGIVFFTSFAVANAINHPQQPIVEAIAIRSDDGVADAHDSTGPWLDEWARRHSKQPNAVTLKATETAPTFLKSMVKTTPMPVAANIIDSSTPRQWWGFPNYERDQDWGLRSWTELAREHGHLGVLCNTFTARRQCGTAFVCKLNSCVECSIDRDCGEHYRCQLLPIGRRHCIPRDLKNQWNWREVVGTVLIVLTAMLSAAAGMGGGGVYVPLLLLLLGLSASEAVPLSQMMIAGGATINVIMFCGDRHPQYKHRPKIDYDVVMMLNPGLAAGVTVGVMCNVVTPQWIIVAVLIVTLVLALQKSLTKGIQQWKKESDKLQKEAEQRKLEGNNNQPSADRKIQVKLADFKSFRMLVNTNYYPMALIASCWCFFFVNNLLKAPQCTTLYWLQLFGMLLMCGLFTKLGSNVIGSREKDADASEGSIEWTPQTLVLYPIFAVAAGFLGGFLGIGGGIIMGPLLIELGMVAEANQATTALFVFLSSTLASIQFIVLGKAMPQFVVWFSIWVLLATFVGQTAIDYVLQKYQRSSLIVLSIAGIIAGSLVMMSIIGVKDTVVDVMRGADMGFHFHSLCMK
mmetsp:Transcript_50200/g.94029  ORF Transcript_50200/g.94029 Transcript_50200/m.94029 type:complete len:575 (-) Transcript_50200:39-1763(-)